MIATFLKKPLRHIRNEYFNWQTRRYIARSIVNQSENGPSKFDFAKFKASTSSFIHEMQMDDSKVQYRYSKNCTRPTLYASAYACMTLGLLGEIRNYSGRQKSTWIDYFDTFQNENDGLFYDPMVMNDMYADTDWWGARHLALHMVNAYTDLGARPKVPFRFLRKYYDTRVLESWLDELDWNGRGLGDGDQDNKIMNIGCLLQYQRDAWHDADAGNAVEFLKKYLFSKVNEKSGMWGDSNLADSGHRSRLVQFGYHLFPIFFYDDHYHFDESRIVNIVLKTQSSLGGFGVKQNSSACEDIDSLDILVRLSGASGNLPSIESDIRMAVERGLDWVLKNQVDDGGFVFRLIEPFTYGHEQLSSLPQQGAMFPTWFRVLFVCYAVKFLGLDNDFVISQCPGYTFT